MLGRAAERVQSSVIKRPFALIELNWHRESQNVFRFRDIEMALWYARVPPTGATIKTKFHAQAV